MSAEEELFSLAGQDMPVTSDEVRQAMNAWAHELAEKQRAAIEKTDDPVFYRGEAGWLPDLIDPEVLNNDVQRP